MKKLFLQAGKIVGTHGVRGTLRVLPWCDSVEILCSFKNLYLNNGEIALNVISAKSHGNVALISFDGINTIEEAEKFRNKVLYINRNDYKMPDGAYFIEDILGMQVYDNNKKYLGVLSDVSSTGANDVWHIKNESKEFLIPKIPDINAYVDFENNKIEITPLKGIFDDENWCFTPFSWILW